MDRPNCKERSMSNRRAKLMAGATVLGLGALGGVALGTNHGIPAGQTLAANGRPGAVVTSASGSATAQPVTVSSSARTRPPIVTRASGGAVPVEVDD
jgi:hypothetical protein